MAFKQRKHLFFINGPVPTPEQAEEAAKLPGVVCFRNATYIREGEPHSIEEHDELHGDIPAVYLAYRDGGGDGQEAPREPRPANLPGEAPIGAGGAAPAAPVPPAGGNGSGWRPNA